MKRISMLAAAGVALGMATPAAAQLVSSTNPDSVVSVLRDAGYRAEVSKDSGGDPLIKSAASGVDFSVLFYGCTAGRNCTSVQFYAGFDKDGIKPAAINQWNATHRFTRAYLDDENDPRFEMDVDLDKGGMSKALFRENLETWTSSLGSFLKHIDF